MDRRALILKIRKDMNDNAIKILSVLSKGQYLTDLADRERYKSAYDRDRVPDTRTVSVNLVVVNNLFKYFKKYEDPGDANTLAKIILQYAVENKGLYKHHYEDTDKYPLLALIPAKTSLTLETFLYKQLEEWARQLGEDKFAFPTWVLQETYEILMAPKKTD